MDQPRPLFLFIFIRFNKNFNRAITGPPCKASIALGKFSDAKCLGFAKISSPRVVRAIWHYAGSLGRPLKPQQSPIP